jgi:hypothetical protein
MSELTAVVVKYIQQEIKQTTTYNAVASGKIQEIKTTDKKI